MDFPLWSCTNYSGIQHKLCLGAWLRPRSFMFWCCRICEKWRKSGTVKLHRVTVGKSHRYSGTKVLLLLALFTSRPPSSDYWWWLARVATAWPTEPSFKLKNGERFPAKSIHKLPAGSTVPGSGSDRPLNKWMSAPGSPLTQHVPPWQKQRSVMPPPPSIVPPLLSVRQLPLSTWNLLIWGS